MIRDRTHFDNYEVLDENVQELCRQLNRIPGVETRFSCEGHKDLNSPYVTLVCDSIESLKRLRDAVSYHGEWKSLGVGYLAVYIDGTWQLVIGPLSVTNDDLVVVDLISKEGTPVSECVKMAERVKTYLDSKEQ